MNWKLRIPTKSMNQKVKDHYLTFSKPMFDLLEELCNAALQEKSETIEIGNGKARFSTGLEQDLHEDPVIAAGYSRIVSGMLILLSEEIETGVLELVSGGETRTVHLATPDISTTLTIG